MSIFLLPLWYGLLKMIAVPIIALIIFLIIMMLKGLNKIFKFKKT